MLVTCFHPVLSFALPPPAVPITFEIIAEGDQFKKTNQSAYLFSTRSELEQIADLVDISSLAVDFQSDDVFAFFANWRGDCTYNLSITDVLEYPSSIEIVIEKSYTEGVNCIALVDKGFLYKVIRMDRRNKPFTLRINTVVNQFP